MASKSFSLSNYKDILEEYREEYRETKGAKHEEVVAKILEKITNDKRYKFKQPEKDLRMVSWESYQWVLVALLTWIQTIKNWYNNHRLQSEVEEAPLVQVGSWNYRRIIQKEYKETITEKMDTTGLTSSDKGWIKKYQQMVTEVIESLGGEEVVKEKYADMVKEWNEAGLPEDLRRE